MAVLKKIRTKWWSQSEQSEVYPRTQPVPSLIRASDSKYDIRPLTISQLDECWRLDQRCFVDGEAYSRETFEYLLTSPESVSYRAVTSGGIMVGFAIGLVEPDHTGQGACPRVVRPARPHWADSARCGLPAAHSRAAEHAADRTCQGQCDHRGESGRPAPTGGGDLIVGE